MELGKIVWVSCRAKKGCEGKQAKVVLFNRLKGGGHATRYKCLECNRDFYLRA